MSERSSSNSSGGIGFVGLLTIVFITLKLIGVIEWSWIWVLSPLWISLCVALAIILVALIIWMIIALCNVSLLKMNRANTYFIRRRYRK